MFLSDSGNRVGRNFLYFSFPRYPSKHLSIFNCIVVDVNVNYSNDRCEMYDVRVLRMHELL